MAWSLTNIDVRTVKLTYGALTEILYKDHVKAITYDQQSICIEYSSDYNGPIFNANRFFKIYSYCLAWNECVDPVATSVQDLIDKLNLLLSTSSVLTVAKNGTVIGAEPNINLIEGSNITLTVADNTVTDSIDVTINSTGGGGGVTSVTATGLLTSSGGTTPDISSFVNKTKLVGRGAVAGIMEEITVGAGLQLVATTLNNTAPFSTPLISKGDIYVRDASVDTRLPVGLDTQMLIADSSTATGLKWTAQPAATPLGYYAMYQDVLTQTIAVINTGYPIKFRTLDLSNGVSVVSDSRITFANTGIYNLQFSVQLENSGTQEHDVTIWLRLNGVDVPGSSGFVAVVAKHGGINGHVLPSWNYLLSVVAGQYYEIVWSATSTQVTMPFIAAGSPPPSTASAIFTVTQQAGIMAGTGITAINSLTGAAQTIAIGTAGSDFDISSVGTTHTLNLPTASATNRGALSSADWSTFNSKLTGFGQFRKAGRWYNNGFFPPANGTFGNVNGVIRYVPVLLDQDVTITRLGVNVTAAAPAGTLCRLGIYSNDPTTTQPLTRLVDAGTVALDGATGQRPTGVISVALTKGLYWLAYFSNAGSGTITGIGSGATFDVKGQANIGPTGFAAFSQSLGFTTLPATVGTLTETNSGTTVCIYYFF